MGGDIRAEFWAVVRAGETDRESAVNQELSDSLWAAEGKDGSRRTPGFQASVTRQMMTVLAVVDMTRGGSQFWGRGQEDELSIGHMKTQPRGFV